MGVLEIIKPSLAWSTQERQPSLSFLQVYYPLCGPFVVSSSGSPIAQPPVGTSKALCGLDPFFRAQSQDGPPPLQPLGLPGPQSSTRAEARKSRHLGHHSPFT